MYSQILHAPPKKTRGELLTTSPSLLAKFLCRRQRLLAGVILAFSGPCANPRWETGETGRPMKPTELGKIAAENL